MKLNRNKLGLAIDIRQPEGRDLIRRLAATSDAIIENFSARVMPSHGLGYESLVEENERLVMLSMQGFGSSGPLADYAAFGPAIEPMTGLTALLGYVGEQPLGTGTAYPDATAGVTAAAALLTALVFQRRGGGQHLDLSQVESTICLLGEYFIAFQLSGRQPERMGNRHPEWAPQGTYACDGDDQWISISIRSDEEWQRFCTVVEDAGLRDYATVVDRRVAHDKIDEAIARWTAIRSKFEVMAVLQQAGVAAGAVLDAKELWEDPHLCERGFFVDAAASDGELFRMPGTALRIDGGQRAHWHAAPKLGEHNRPVLRSVLGLSEAEIVRLEAAGVLGSARD